MIIWWSYDDQWYYVRGYCDAMAQMFSPWLWMAVRAAVRLQDSIPVGRSRKAVSFHGEQLAVTCEILIFSGDTLGLCYQFHVRIMADYGLFRLIQILYWFIWFIWTNRNDFRFGALPGYFVDLCRVTAASASREHPWPEANGFSRLGYITLQEHNLYIYIW